MSLPTSIRVGPHDVPVFYKPRLEDEDEGSVVSGLFFVEDFHIEIRQGLKGSRMAEVLMHEVLHAVHSNTRFTDDEDEERAVTILASALTQLAKDNPEFIRSWLAHAIS